MQSLLQASLEAEQNGIPVDWKQIAININNEAARMAQDFKLYQERNPEAGGEQLDMHSVAAAAGEALSEEAEPGADSLQ